MIKKEFEISYAHVDYNNDLNISYLFDYIMDMGNYHSEEVGLGTLDLKDLGYTWMLYQLKIKVNRLPKGKEKIYGNTWISKTDKLKSIREIEFFDEKDNLILECTCVWLLIDIEKVRAVKLPGFIKEKFSVEKEKDIALENLNKIKIQEEGKEIFIYKSDIDYNKHVNSGVYLRWMVDSIDKDNTDLREIEIYYKDQTFLKDKKVYMKIQATEDGYYHQISTDKKDTVFGKTKWS